MVDVYLFFQNLFGNPENIVQFFHRCFFEILFDNQKDPPGNKRRNQLN